MKFLLTVFIVLLTIGFYGAVIPSLYKENVSIILLIFIGTVYFITMGFFSFKLFKKK